MSLRPLLLHARKSASIYLHRANYSSKAFALKTDWIVNGNASSTFNVYNKATQTLVGTSPAHTINHLNQAVESADASFSSWKALTAKERGAILHKWAQLIMENKTYLAALLTEEQGKPLTESNAEIIYGTSFITWFAEEARRIYGDIIPTNNKNQRILVLHQPVGVCALITPWNFPMAMITRKAAAALAVGCTAIVKPAEDTPLMAHAIVHLAHQAGVPKDVLQIISCPRSDVAAIGKAFCEHPLVSKVSFTGSIPVGKILLAQCASTVKRVSMELGGNAPFIVFKDADIDNAVDGAIASRYRNSGQTCVCTNRMLVHQSIADEFAKKLAIKAAKLFVGNGHDSRTIQGPLINNAAVEKVERLVKSAVEDGAKVLCGGSRHELGGNFFQPTVITNVKTSMDIFKEEIFGPVSTITTFTSEKSAIAMANDSRAGLAGYFFTQDISRIWRVAEALEVGMVGVNVGVISSEVAPFGGVKESGLGREGSKYGVNDYINTKYVCLDVSPQPSSQ